MSGDALAPAELALGTVPAATPAVVGALTGPDPAPTGGLPGADAVAPGAGQGCGPRHTASGGFALPKLSPSASPSATRWLLIPDGAETQPPGEARQSTQ
jgi:hypothetical protein